MDLALAGTEQAAEFLPRLGVIGVLNERGGEDISIRIQLPVRLRLVDVRAPHLGEIPSVNCRGRPGLKRTSGHGQNLAPKVA